MRRKTLSADGMVGALRKSFEKIRDTRTHRASIGTADTLMTALQGII